MKKNPAPNKLINYSYKCANEDYKRNEDPKRAKSPKNAINITEPTKYGDAISQLHLKLYSFKLMLDE